MSLRNVRVERVRRTNASHPAQFRANPEVTRKYRFTSTSATATTITSQLLLASAGVLADTATSGQAVFQSVKVLFVEIWAPPAMQGATSTCSVLWPRSLNSQPREVSDTTNSVSTPAHVRTSPPAMSLAGFWNPPSSAIPLFTLVAPPGSIIDVGLGLVMGDGAPNSNAAVLVGATIGGMYYCSLDSKTSAGSIYPPVSLSTL